MEMLDYALHYQKLGFSVIPISPVSKKPIVKFMDKTFSENQLRAMWRDNPSANIALRTDSFFVIDIDIHKSDGFESFENWEASKLIPKTLQAKTAGGGRHIFLKKRDDITLNQHISFLPGVDLKANPNNYVLVAPSFNSNGSYEWDKENSTSDGSMTEAPRELVEALKELQDYDDMPDFSSYKTNGGSSKTTKIFEQIVYGLGDEGGRNNALAKFVGGLLVRNVSIDATYELARLANNNTQNPLDNKEFETTFKSIYEKDMRRKGGNQNNDK